MPITPYELNRLVEGWEEATPEYKEAVLRAIRGDRGHLLRKCSKCGDAPAIIHRCFPGKYRYIWRCYMDTRTANPSDLFCEPCGFDAILKGDERH